MTFKEFLEFISQTNGHFIGFLIVLGTVTSFGYKILNSFFKNFIKPMMKGLFEDKEEKK